MLDFDDQLAQSCGQVRPMILHARHQDHRTHSKYVVTKPYAIIGRNSSCDICLNHEDVSKQHAYLQVLDGKLFCVDQGSRHGIFWKDTPQLYGWVQPGQPIEIGPFEITLEQSVGAEAGIKCLRNTAPFFAKYTSKVPSNAVVEINGNRKFDVNHQLALIGRCKHCNIILDTDEISPIHASIVRTLDGKYWLVVPIGIKVKVNGTRCVSMELHHEDVIAIGNHTLTFTILTPSTEGEVINKGSSGTIKLQPDGSGSHSLKSPHTPAPSLIEIDSAITKKLQHVAVAPQESDLSQSIFLDRSSVEQVGLVPAAPVGSSAITYRPVTLPALPRKTSTRSNLAPQQAELAEKKPEGDTHLVNAFMHHMKLMQQEMMTQMRMNMEMMAEFMVNLQQQHMDQVREEMNHLAKINQELMQLRQSLVSSTPKPELASESKSSAHKQLEHLAQPSVTKTDPPQVTKTKIVVPVDDTIDETHQPPSHDWITKRIAILEGERKTSWEKMKSAVFGK